MLAFFHDIDNVDIINFPFRAAEAGKEEGEDGGNSMQKMPKAINESS